MNKKGLLFSSALLIALFLVGCYLIFSKTSSDYIDAIEGYAKTHDELKFDRFTDFDWDIAYNYISAYGHGEEIKEKTGYNFELESGVDHLRRLLFFKDGKLMKVISYEYGVFEFPASIEYFYPETVFEVDWIDAETQLGTMKHLVLRIQ